MKKICFIASSGGHLEQLLMLKPLMEIYPSFIVTEKTAYSYDYSFPTYYIKQVNRRQSLLVIYMLCNLYSSFKIIIKEKPDIIISTGALVTLPISCIGKIFGKKIIYIESFSKITSKTKTGRLMYYLSDRFYIQWESLKLLYPGAIYKGGLY